MKALLFTFALLTAVSVLAAENCKSLIDSAENLGNQGQWGRAQSTALKAISACKKEKVKSARPYMVLATGANATQDHNATIKWSKQALEEEPGLPLAYMDMSSGYIGLGRYDEAVAACKTGLKTNNPWSAKLNFNAGFAIFQKYVVLEQYAKAVESEPYFQASQKLDPNIGSNYFYLGTLKYAVRNDYKGALPLLKRGCELKDQPSCKSQGEVEAKLASAPPQQQPAAGSQRNAASAPVSGNEAQLYAKIRAGYIKKGVPAASADQTVANLKNSMSQMTPEQRMPVLQSMLQGL